MLSKEECEQVLMNICSSNSRIEDRKVFKDLINEHFELVEKYEMLDNTYSMFYEDYLKPKPYKFEDLKEGMWVWDSKEMWIRNIVILFKPCKQYPKGSFKAWADSCEETLDFVEFEDNRFYPVYIAK